MDIKQYWKVVGVSAFAFTVLLAGLTGLRVGNLEPSTSVQSLVVYGTALVVFAAVAYRAYRGGDVIGSWFLVLGPSLAFALNLFIPVTRGGFLPLIGYSLVVAVLLSSVLAPLGLSAGYAARRVQNG